MIRTKSMTLDVIVQHCWGTVGECGCFGSDKLEVCLQIAIHPRDTFSGGVTTLGNSLLGKSVMPVMDLVMHNTCVCTIGHAPLGMSKDLMNYKFTCLIMFVDPKIHARNQQSAQEPIQLRHHSTPQGLERAWPEKPTVTLSQDKVGPPYSTLRLPRDIANSQLPHESIVVSGMWFKWNCTGKEAGKCMEGRNCWIPTRPHYDRHSILHKCVTGDDRANTWGNNGAMHTHTYCPLLTLLYN